MRRRGAIPRSAHAVAAASALAVAACGPPVRQFSVPSDSMAPTLVTGDRVMGRMERPAAFNRGDVLLIDVNGQTWIVRVVGLPGDRIQMIDGIVILNGRPVTQRLVRTEPSPPEQRHRGSTERRRLSEQLPGEAGSHEIYDQGLGMADDTEVQTVRPGYLFLLGDNRDDAMDSRFAAQGGHGGLGQVSFDRVRGVVQEIYRRQ